MEELLSCERRLFLWLNSTHTPFLDSLLWQFTSVWIWCPPVLLLAYICFRRPSECIPATVAAGAVFLLCGLVADGVCKPCFARFRPSEHPLYMYSIVLLNDYRASGLYGFISGHTAGAFGFAVWSLLLQRNACYTAVILLWAFLMGWSRIYLGAHFISDVAGGILAGSLLGWAVYAAYRKVLKYIFTLKQ